MSGNLWNELDEYCKSINANRSEALANNIVKPFLEEWKQNQQAKEALQSVTSIDKRMSKSPLGSLVTSVASPAGVTDAEREKWAAEIDAELKRRVQPKIDSRDTAALRLIAPILSEYYSKVNGVIRPITQPRGITKYNLLEQDRQRGIQEAREYREKHGQPVTVSFTELIGTTQSLVKKKTSSSQQQEEDDDIPTESDDDIPTDE